MKLARPFLITFVLLALAPAAWAAPEAASGGALAQPPRQAEGGGALAPERYGAPAAASESTSDGGAAAAEAARDERPTWKTEPPEPEWAPYPGVAQQTVGEAGGDAAEVQTAAGGEPDRAERVPAAGNPAAGSALPWTGLEIVALAAIGLGLLTLGIALRPRRLTRR